MSEALRIRKDTGRQKMKAGAYIGYQGYASILACLKEPRDYREVAEITGTYPQKLRRLLKQFHAMGLIHRAGWAKPPHGCHIPVFQLGQGEDAPIPLTSDGRPQPYQDHRPRLQPRVVAFASAVQALQVFPSTLAQVSHESGIDEDRLSDLLRHMRSPAVRLIHIASWKRRLGGKGPWVAMYQWKPDAKDAKCPGAMPREKRLAHGRAARDIRRPIWDQTIAALKRGAGFQAARI